MTDNQKKPKRKYDANCYCYLTDDRKYYIYEIWDPDTGCVKKQKLKVGRDITVEMALALVESDETLMKAEKKHRESQDALFRFKVRHHFLNRGNKRTVDPWLKLFDERNNIEAVLFPESENPEIELVRHILDEECTEAQKDLFYLHFGLQLKLETIRQAEAAQTGRLVSNAAFNNRKNKILNKIAKALGTERVKRQGYTRKTDQ